MASSSRQIANQGPYLMIPHAVRGRDFDEHFRHFTFPLFEICESIPYYSPTNFKMESQFCDCMIYSKCQFLKVHYPITLKLFQQSIADTNTNINSKTQCFPSPFYIRCSIGHIGRTSSTQFVELMYRNTAFASFVCVVVHVDRNTRKPIQNCKKLMDYKQTYGDIAHNTRLYQQMRGAMDSLSGLINEANSILYARSFELNPIDRDWNRHMNQSVYTKRIEDALYDYHKEFAEGHYVITQMDHLFFNETKVEMDGSLNCVVTISMHKKNADKTEQIIGRMMQNDKECLQYCVTLEPGNAVKHFNPSSKI